MCVPPIVYIPQICIATLYLYKYQSDLAGISQYTLIPTLVSSCLVSSNLCSSCSSNQHHIILTDIPYPDPPSDLLRPPEALATPGLVALVVLHKY